jgi:hypothetical protein
MLKKSASPIEETPGEYGVDELDQKKPSPLNEKDKKDSLSDELNQAMPDEQLYCESERTDAQSIMIADQNKLFETANK